jgi:hypothetical protein
MTSHASQDPSSTLTDRVRAHVAEAGRRLDNRARDANAKQLRPTRSTTKAASVTGSLETERDVQSLRTVYREMRGLYRNYRRKAGTPAVPELRSAVHAFRRGESLTSLVHIASFLDDRKLLAW